MTIAVGCGHVSGLLVQPFPRLLALMWFARQVLISFVGSTPGPEEGSPASTTDRSTSCHQHLRNPRDALRRVPLKSLALRSCAAAAAITHRRATGSVGELMKRFVAGADR